MLYDPEPDDHNGDNHYAAVQRIRRLIETYLPNHGAFFQELLQRTGANIMGSFSLFSLAQSWTKWNNPGDMDVFFPPTTQTLIHRNQRLFDEHLIQCGYIRVILPPRLEPYAVFYQPTYNTRMIVFTYYKRVPGAKFVIQLVFPNFIPSGPEWKLRMLESFDLSCCSVAYDGKFFYVTHDNRSATTQPVTVRQNHPSTARRVDKYLRRGFAFYIWI